MFSSFRCDFTKTGVKREPLMTLKEMSYHMDVSYSTLTRRFRDMPPDIEPLFYRGKRKYYSRRELFRWADSIGLGRRTDV